MNTAHECVNDCGSVVECEIPCSQRGEHFCENCAEKEGSRLTELLSVHVNALRNKHEIDEYEATDELADFIFALSKECGLPIVLDPVDRKVIAGIVRRVRR